MPIKTINNLKGIDLKNSFKSNLYKCLKKAKNPDIVITFIFSGYYQGSNFEYKEKISYFAGGFLYKGVRFNTNVSKLENIFNIIVDNFHCDDFSFISFIERHGEETCKGHGEYWGTDYFTLVYTRIEDK